MAFQVVMPKLSDTMEEGRVLKWYKREGEKVEGGEALAEIETDKANIEMEAFGSGNVRKILVPEGEKCPVGTLIAVIAEAEEDIKAILEGKEAAPPVKPLAAEAKKKPVETPLPVREVPVDASPVARKMAKEAGIDIALIPGTGPGGRVIKEDVEAYLKQREAKPGEVPPVAAPAVIGAEYQDKELSLMRAAIARRMAESKSSAPHFYLTMDIDMGRAADLHRTMKELNPATPVTVTDMIVKAAALALRRQPAVNVAYLDGKMRSYQSIHIGVAVALEEGLITPVVRNADKKPLVDIAKEVKEMTERARARKLRPEEYTGATFTISNLGMFGIDEFSAIINPPEGAILAVGAIKAVPVAVEGHIAIGQRMKVTGSFDHRVIDGATGARFLQEFKKIIEQPLQLVA